MRLSHNAASAALAAILVTFDVSAGGSLGTCDARSTGTTTLPLTWRTPTDHAELDRWCHGVGPAVVHPAPAGRRASAPPPIQDLVVLTWNAHLAEGRLDELIAALRGGRFTAGAPVEHFVLLVQELYRRGPIVPPPTVNMRSAFAIKAKRPDTPDAADFARTLGLPFLYVPSMRNGAHAQEDRGNAVISTEPFTTAIAQELPLERQRRVAIAVTLDIATTSGPQRLVLIDAHLEPLSSPRTLWFFRNPRPRQLRAIFDLAASNVFGRPEDLAGIVLGGDFNTIQGGTDEPAYALARSWSESLGTEDPRSTHRMGRLDYLFFKSAGRWKLSTTRIDDRFGSDHHPVLSRFAQ